MTRTHQQRPSDHTRSNRLEEWRDVVSPAGYRVSSLGRVLGKRGRPLSPHKDKNGYMVVKMFDENEGGKNVKVHRLVCEAFHGPEPAGRPQVAHLDGSKDNNTPENLEWVSAAENSRQAIAHGTVLSGEGHPKSVLTVEAVKEIWESSESSRAVARRLSVGIGCVKSVRSGETWGHVTGSLTKGDWPAQKTLIPLRREVVMDGTLEAAAARLGVSSKTIARRRARIRKGEKG